MLPLGDVAAFLVDEGRVGVEDAVLDEVPEGEDVAGAVQLLQPSLGEAERAILNREADTRSEMRL